MRKDIKNRIYISGKIDEEVISDATRKKFDIIEKKLESENCMIFNPTNQEWQQIISENYRSAVESMGERNTISRIKYTLFIDIQQLTKCDAIYMLPDFLDSPRAKAEHAFAIATGMQVYYDDELYRDGTLRAKYYKKNRFPWSKQRLARKI